jgi:hypothetical protein
LPVAIGNGVAIQMVIEGGKLTCHHFRNAVFTATGESDGTFCDPTG